jgi:hypothetical protein
LLGQQLLLFLEQLALLSVKDNHGRKLR